MDAAQWPQEIGMEGPRGIIIGDHHQRRPRPEKDKQALNCPRCNSTNTKFCYYNNYSLSQPRYMCKTCKRYWTEGGSLRNVPVGGGSRKNNISKRSSTSPLPLPSSKKQQLPPPHHHDLTTPNSFPQSSTTSQTQNPNKIHEGQDLNLAFPPPTPSNYKYTTPFVNTSQMSPVELFNFKKYEIASIYSSSCGFPMQELKPSLNFGVDRYGNWQGVQENSSARLFFPFEDLKIQQLQAQSSTSSSGKIAHEFDHDAKNNIRGEGGDQASGYWSGMLGGGGGSWLA